MLRRDIECVDRVSWAGDDLLERAFLADRVCLTGRETDSSSSDDWGLCRFPPERTVCLLTRLVTDSGSSTARTGTDTSSPPMNWFSLPSLVERNDLVLCTVDCLLVEVDFLFAEVAEEDGFRDKDHAMITSDFGRRNV